MSDSMPTTREETREVSDDALAQTNEEHMLSKALIQVREFVANARKVGADTSLAIVDLDEVHRLYLLWQSYLARVKPYYG